MNIPEADFIELLKMSIDQDKKNYKEYLEKNNNTEAAYYHGKIRALISVLYIFDKKAAMEEGY